MVKDNRTSSEMQSTYYLKPGQTLQNTKIADRSLALLVSKSAFNRFVDYTTENERLAAAAEEEAAKLAAFKKATYEMSKSWGNTIANVQKRRKDELLGRKKREDEARAEFVKDLAARNAAERAEIVNEARKLLLWKKPQCRLINGALLSAECYRQLDAQVALQKSINEADRERDAEYARMIKEDAENAIKEEQKKSEERLKKNRTYGVQLKNQIDGMDKHLRRLELQDLESEKEDLKNMAKEIRTVEECEAEQALKRKKELKKIFIDALEEKKQQAIEFKRNEDFENKALGIFQKSKERIKQIGQLKMTESRNQKLKRSDALAKKCAAVRHSRENEEEEIRRRVMEEQETLEREKREAKKKYEEKVREDIKQYRKQLAETKERRANEEKDIMAWETLQRFKRDEYNKEVLLEKSERERKKKTQTALFLRQQMAEREAKRQREELMSDETAQMKANIERTNEKVLAYGQEVLEECKALNDANPKGPLRPLFPVEKVIYEFKKESGLIPSKVYEERARPKRRRRKQLVCTKPPEQICYV